MCASKGQVWQTSPCCSLCPWESSGVSCHTPAEGRQQSQDKTRSHTLSLKNSWGSFCRGMADFVLVVGVLFSSHLPQIILSLLLQVQLLLFLMFFLSSPVLPWTEVLKSDSGDVYLKNNV